MSFLDELVKWLPENQPDVKDAVKRTLAVLKQNGNRFIIANSTWGPTVNRASGISIYFPSAAQYLTDYSDLQFSKKYSWNRFLESLFKL
jgi:hypothetical protein